MTGLVARCTGPTNKSCAGGVDRLLPPPYTYIFTNMLINSLNNTHSYESLSWFTSTHPVMFHLHYVLDAELWLLDEDWSSVLVFFFKVLLWCSSAVSFWFITLQHLSTFFSMKNKKSETALVWWLFNKRITITRKKKGFFTNAYILSKWKWL